MSVRVVGYAYQADIYCTDCMRTLAHTQLTRLGVRPPGGDAEAAVTAWAHARGLTYPTGTSDAHDTTVFPFPILSTTEDANGRCGQAGCGQHLD